MKNIYILEHFDFSKEQLYMKNIYILEHFDFSKEQLKELKKLGNVHYFQKA